MSIKDAVRSLPAWPALVVAPILTLAVGVFHYAPLRTECLALARSRDALFGALAAADKRVGGVIDISQIFPEPEWNNLRIVEGAAPAGRTLDCPFGWGLKAAERRTMIEAGRLTWILLRNDDAIVRVVEFDGAVARFVLPENPVPRAETRLIAKADPSGRLVLSPSD